MVSIYSQIRQLREQGKKQLAVLIDPDALHMQHIDKLIQLSRTSTIDYFFIGGSLITDDVMTKSIERLKKNTDIPTVIFPGSQFQVNNRADALLFLSLISGRNPELLIGQQVIAAPYIKNSELEVLSTGYMLIDGGVPTTASYISSTQPIPRDKPKIASSTAMAGEMLGHQLIYLDAGSGAKHPVSGQIIKSVRNAVDIPIIVGGGIRSIGQCESAIEAGADILVIGNAIENDPDQLSYFADYIHDLHPKSL